MLVFLNLGFSFTIHQSKKEPPEVFFKKSVFKNFANVTGKQLCWSLFLIKLTPVNLLKRGSNTGVFLWTLRIFKYSFFYRTPLVAASADTWKIVVLQKIKLSKKRVKQHMRKKKNDSRSVMTLTQVSEKNLSNLLKGKCVVIM